MKPAPREYRYKHLRLGFNRPLIMGVVNATPDSFSDGGKYLKPRNAIEQAARLIESGAGIIDIGGESSRPGAKPVSAKEEGRRVLPVIRKLVKRYPKVPFSIDSYKPEVIRFAMDEGAGIINDITGLRNPDVMAIAEEHKVPVVIMHMKGMPGTMQKRPTYKNVVAEVVLFFKERIKACKKHGVTKIILDPGIGFGKTVNHNLAILRELDKIVELGYPVMVGASRKSFIGNILGADVNQRESGSLAITALAVRKGASIIRAHEVKENLEAAMVSAAVRKGRALRF
ncbi:Dihydropteroate synthase [hydrothermal vent metagenome]|uniref:dihydropteroate synthase n=1 Tax=hydrothermal vent metagenome TaxID=652676 RepID=A0A3B1C0N4_9ZZZZ